jgi:protein O-GlcNAc transferase
MQKSAPQRQLETAVAHHRAGRFSEAEVIYKELLSREPNNPDVLYLMGAIQSRNGQKQQAVDLIMRAISLRPNQPHFYETLSQCLLGLGRMDEAIAAVVTAIRLNPNNERHHYDYANILLQTTHVNEAIEALRAALRINPNFAEAHQNLGCALHRTGSIEDAEKHLRRALQINPNMPDAYNNLGGVLTTRMKLKEAGEVYQQALKLRPDFAAAMANLGSVMRMAGQAQAAIKLLQQAIQLNPNLPEAYNNLGIALKEEGRLDEAAAVYLKCLSLRPNMGDTINNLGNAYKDSGNVHDAVGCYGRSLGIGFSNPGVLSNLVYTLQFHPGYDDESLYREQRRWNEIYAKPLVSKIRRHDNDRSPDRKLKIAYVSPYFYQQAETFFVAPLLKNHDHSRYEIHAYASVIRPDSMTETTKGYVDHYHDVLGMPGADLAQKIRADGIDVAIDLAMHMAHNHMVMFAQKPAPVQVAWLAYPGGTGLDAMDYRITDPHMDPMDKSLACYREESYRIEDCWCCYHPLINMPPTPLRQPGPIRFASINNPCKNNDAMLGLWARLLSKVSDSRLLMQAFSESHRQKIRSIFQKVGVAPSRVEFVPRRLRSEYMQLYHAIDICLDPLPYNGITTTCDALWMGVPVVTLVGKTAAGRAGVSILATTGLPELIAYTEDQFIEIASGLAGDAPRLAALRAGLRERFEKSPVMDAAGFARKMEVAYRWMWQRWCERPEP